LRVFWYVAIGAALGGVSRFYLGAFIQQRAGADFPAGTLIVNVSGSFLLGFVMRYALASSTLGPELRALLTTGFCGGYTTFSTFTYETVMLTEDGEYARAAFYVALSLGVSLLATFVGFVFARELLAFRGRI